MIACLPFRLPALCVVLGVTGLCVCSGDEPDPGRDRLIVESLLRIKDVDITGNEKLQAAILRHAATIRGQENYFLLAERFRLPSLDNSLFELATSEPSNTAGVRAAGVLARNGQLSRFLSGLVGGDADIARGAAAVLGHLDDPAIVPALSTLLPDKKHSRPLRTAATYSLGRTINGQRALLAVVVSKQLPEDLKVAAGQVLFGSADATIRKEVGKYLMLPATADATPLPPLSVLLKKRGDVTKGLEVFNKVGTCAKCHRIRGVGKEVGPDLSEIGGKLSREALFVSILDPSAGISHSYETYNIILESGNVLSGILISKTDDSITIRTLEAIDKSIAKGEIDEMVKTGVSIMPADLQKAMTASDLVNVIEFLLTLKKQ